MRNIKCICGYDGSKFNGWQIQNDFRSVQEEIELALFKIHKEKVSITGSGRTDKGVHAYGQVFNFKTNLTLSCEEWKRALNANMPYDVRIKSVEEVNEDFHSRFSCKCKTYQYLLNMNEFDPIKKDYIYQYGKKLNIEKMNNAAQLFVGEHDFEHFCSNSIEEVKSFIKTIYSFEITEDNGIVIFTVKGSGFLRYQVRMMVGNLIEIGALRKTDEIIVERLDKKEALTSMYNAPSNGLYLVEVNY